MSQSEQGPLAQSLTAYAEWAESQHLSLYLSEGKVNMDIQVPVAWPIEVGSPERRPTKTEPYPATIEVIPTENGEVFQAAIKLVNNLEVLTASVEPIHPHDPEINMFDYFHPWVLAHIEAMQKNGIAYNPMILTSLFDALAATGDVSWEDQRSAFFLDYQIIDDQPDKKYSGKVLGIGWQAHQDEIIALYQAVSARPDVWETAGIPGTPGDWNAFLPYMLEDIRTAMTRIMPVLMESAITFGFEEAPRIVWETIQQMDPDYPESIDYASHAILGHPITDEPWLTNEMKRQLQMLASHDPAIAGIIDNKSLLRHPRPATAVLRDQPIRDMTHIVGSLYVNGSYADKKVEILFTGNQILYECALDSSGLKAITTYWKEFISDWQKYYAISDSVIPMLSTIDQYRNETGNVVFGFNLPRRFSVEDQNAALIIIKEQYILLNAFADAFVQRKQLEIHAQKHTILQLLLSDALKYHMRVTKKKTDKDPPGVTVFKGDLNMDLLKGSIPFSVICTSDGMFVECTSTNHIDNKLRTRWEEFTQKWQQLHPHKTVGISLNTLDTLSKNKHPGIALGFYIPNNAQIDSIDDEIFALYDFYADFIRYIAQFDMQTDMEELTNNEPMLNLIIPDAVASLFYVEKQAFDFVHFRGHFHKTAETPKTELEITFLDDGVQVEVPIDAYQREKIYQNFQAFADGWYNIQNISRLVGPAMSAKDQMGLEENPRLTIGFFIPRDALPESIRDYLLALQYEQKVFTEYTEWFRKQLQQ